MDEPTIKALQDTISSLEGVTKHQLDAAQHHALFEGLEFILNARVVKCTVHVMQVDSPDGPEPGVYHKCRLVARIDGKNIRRTIAITSDPLAQVLRCFARFHDRELHTVVHGYKSRVRGLRKLVPKDTWEKLGAQLAEKRLELDEDAKAQADFKERFDACKERIFQKDFQNLRFEMARLQRRGWNQALIMSAWNEALVQGVMES
jgi:hypothetical protein